MAPDPARPHSTGKDAMLKKILGIAALIAAITLALKLGSVSEEDQAPLDTEEEAWG